TPVPGMGDTIRKTYWNKLLTGATAPESDQPAAAAADRANEKAVEAIKRKFDEKVEEKRADLRKEHGDNLTSAHAEAALRKSDTPEDRAAVLLELNASKTAEKEAEHLLAKFTDIVSDNPRVMKRMINAFAMRRAIGIVESDGTPMEVLARWTILEQ